MNRLVLTLALLFTAAASAAQDPLVVYADTVYTMAGAPIVDGAVVIADGRIVEVGQAGRVRVPGGARELRGAVVTPGFVDVRSTVGLSGLLNQPQDQDALDSGGPLQPSLRAMDAYGSSPSASRRSTPATVPARWRPARRPSSRRPTRRWTRRLWTPRRCSR